MRFVVEVFSARSGCSLFLWLLAVCWAASTGYADDLNANSHSAATALQKWYNSKGLWDTVSWWHSAVCLEALEEEIAANNDWQYLCVVSNTFALNSAGDFLNRSYDDEGWWALAWVQAYDLTGEVRYLTMAKRIFADIRRGWDDVGDGGVWWNSKRNFKNAIPNELFLLVAVRLHQRTPADQGPGSYLDWATREWAWFKNSGLINEEHLVNDGLTKHGFNNGAPTWTYNQGVLIGGLAELYKTTGERDCLSEATAIADAVITKLTDANGILREPCEWGACDANGAQFKGIFMAHLASLYDLTRRPDYWAFLSKNAHSLWLNGRNGTNQLGLRWAGPFDSPDAARQSSGLLLLNALAEPQTPRLLFAKGAGDPAFQHAVGAASGILGWCCNPATVTKPGFMLYGPYTTGVANGSHTAHFRMQVDALRESTTNLVRIDVRESTKGTILASRELAWNSFTEADQPQDFTLPFAIMSSEHALEFRVYWHQAPQAPSLKLTDVSIDGYLNWTAANLEHEVGRLDGHNGWEADPIRDKTSGFLVKGSGTGELPAGGYTALFELKVDNFNLDSSKVATISVVEAGSGRVVASRDLSRSQFPNTLCREFGLSFNATEGKRYEARTFWYYAATAPRLTQRSVLLEPGINNVQTSPKFAMKQGVTSTSENPDLHGE